MLGDWLNTIAIFVLLEQINAASSYTFGTVIILKSLPHLLLSPLAGRTVDKMDRRKVMIAADLMRAVIVSGILLTPLFSNFYWVAVLLVLQHSCSSFFEPARSAILPDIVDRGDLSSANALGAMVWSTMLTLGAALGGVLTEFIGWRFVIGLDCLSYLISAYLISQIRSSSGDFRSQSSSVGESHEESFSEVFVLFRNRPQILVLALAKGLHGMGGGAYLILTVLGQKVFTSGQSAALGISLLYTARGLGGFVGPFIGRRLAGDDPLWMKRMIFTGLATAAVCYAALGYAPDALFAAAAVFVGHIGGSMVWVFSSVLLQFEVEGRLRGRVFSFDLAAFTLTQTISILVFSFLLDQSFLSPRSAASAVGFTWGLSACVWIVLQRCCKRSMH